MLIPNDVLRRKLGIAAAWAVADLCALKPPGRGGFHRSYKAEVELGQMAKEKGSSDAVKSFGERMMKDHGQATEQLESVAGKLGVTLPNKVNATDQATKDQLEKLSGKEFDEAYMRDMVTDHTKDVAEFKHAASSASNPDVKNFAQQTLPTLQDHLKEAQKIASSTAMSAENR